MKHAHQFKRRLAQVNCALWPLERSKVDWNAWEWSIKTMRTFVFLLFLGAICIYALYRGGGPERLVAGVVIAMVVLDPAVHLFTPLEYAQLDPGHLVIDLAGWIGFLAIALRANRFWPLCVVSLQTISLVAHSARLLDMTIHPKAYMIMQIATSYPLLVLLMIGTYCHQKRLRANGTDRSWRNS